MATTAPATTRYLALDALRGFAVMGILAMNIVAFAMPTAAYFNPMAFSDGGAVDIATWAFNFVFVDSKMRGLFSLLFGASTLLVIERAAQAGRNGALSHYSRMFWLLVFGCLHFYLIWFGDILVLYALCGCILYLLRNRSVRALWIYAAVFFTLQLLWVGAFGGFALAVVYGGIEATPEINEAIDAIREMSGPNSVLATEEVLRFRGGYGGIVSHRLTEMAWFPFISFTQTSLETLGLMAIGMALYRSGFLTGTWGIARYRRWAKLCMAISLPILVALAVWQIVLRFEPIFVFDASVVFSMPFDVILTVGYAAVLILAVKSFANSRIIQRVAAAGRAAFTNYLGTSILMTFIFYGYGLGLFGRFNRLELYLFVFLAWAIMLLWSKPWLMRYRYGPFEWLWRSLARIKPQPMRLWKISER